MNFATEADAYANRFPALTKVMLNRGAVEFDPLTPPADITLLSTSVALVVRADLEPSLITLLSFAVLNNPRSAFDKAGDPVLFFRPGTFPHTSDPEYRVADETRQLFKTGELPIALRSIAPAVHEAGFSYSVTGFIADHGAQTVLLLIPSLVILLPLLRVIPSVYAWSVRRRLLYWYRQLKALEKNLDHPVQKAEMSAYQAEIERIDAGVRRIRYPLNFSDQFYHLRVHIDLVRQRLLPENVGTTHRGGVSANVSCPQGDIGEGRFAPRQGVDNAAEQNRLGELHETDRDGGQRQQDGQPPLGAQHAERPPVNLEEVHRPPVPSPSDYCLAWDCIVGPSQRFLNLHGTDRSPARFRPG